MAKAFVEPEGQFSEKYSELFNTLNECCLNDEDGYSKRRKEKYNIFNKALEVLKIAQSMELSYVELDDFFEFVKLTALRQEI